MKTLVALLSLLSFSAFAGDVYQTINQIESTKRAKCNLVSSIETRGFLMMSQRSETYQCIGQVKNFSVKLKIRTIYTSSGKLETVYETDYL